MATPTEGAESASGMPQLDFSTFPNQIFWLVVALLALYFIVTRVAMPRVGGIIEDRFEVISNDLEVAADLKQKAEAAEAAYHKALAEARSEAQAIAAETKAEIQKELALATEKADAEIAAKAAESEARIDEIRASAVKSVEEVATETSAAIVAALMPDVADDAAVKAAVANRMKG
ncbi:F0F1 ATP synthase subunit B' [Oceanibium sediminis]|uniref:F0F1 ATP synthase subunit B' n=1 Tax=Oceanibium sediminis TaxID=2026339 RepID=UPI000DD4B1C2|nr:F0F1 ATP synthase subunit B' [Oceanibium sediminis]